MPTVEIKGSQGRVAELVHNGKRYKPNKRGLFNVSKDELVDLMTTGFMIEDFTASMPAEGEDK